MDRCRVAVKILVALQIAQLRFGGWDDTPAEHKDASSPFLFGNPRDLGQPNVTGTCIQKWRTCYLSFRQSCDLTPHTSWVLGFFSVCSKVALQVTPSCFNPVFHARRYHFHVSCPWPFGPVAVHHISKPMATMCRMMGQCVFFRHGPMCLRNIVSSLLHLACLCLFWS